MTTISTCFNISTISWYDSAQFSALTHCFQPGAGWLGCGFQLEQQPGSISIFSRLNILLSLGYLAQL
jgi:hypothetical protein